MTLYPASLMLMKIGDGQDPESFTTIGGLQNIALNITHEHPENPTVDSGKWRSVLDSAGMSRVAISGEGVYTDSSGETRMLGHALAHSGAEYQFHFANGDSMAGRFVISDYNRFGNVEGEELFTITLLNDGAVSFSAA